MRVVMSNWASGTVGPKVPDCKSLLYELMFLSLLYDEVLIPDLFILSTKLAKWLDSDDRLLPEIFDLGTLKVIKHPIDA
jgi:hypothetical protein